MSKEGGAALKRVLFGDKILLDDPMYYAREQHKVVLLPLLLQLFMTLEIHY